MKSSSSSVLVLSLTFACFGASSNLCAQDGPVASASDVRQCVEWMKATVGPQIPASASDFCSGKFNGHYSGWGQIGKCGLLAQQTAGTEQPYCVSSGYIST